MCEVFTAYKQSSAFLLFAQVEQEKNKPRF